MDSTKDQDENAREKSDVALREETVLAFWKEHDIFNKSLEKESPKGEFIFYDGPPFATGLPHYGHILASTIKDAIPRFWTMKGYRVPRKWGWDCHGLPLENLIEKKLGLATKRDIEAYGIQNFNEQAREAVLEYADDWKTIIPRMGRWADMDHDYKTMDPTYTESVWWVFSQLHAKGLVYEGFKSMHLCPRCGTTLSNFEVNQGYKDIKDIAVTVKLPLLDADGSFSGASLLVWTTTPWTLPGNMAAAVHKDIVYSKVLVRTDAGEEQFILAKERLAQLATEDFEIVEELKGAELIGRSYVPPFAYWQTQSFDGKDKAWKIYHADYVEIGAEGTGAVHIAPAYGEEDMELAKVEGIPIVHHVDPSGHFMDFVTDFAGQLVKPKDDDDAQITHLDADIEVLKKLQEARDEYGPRLFRKENITHSYPHCWRCDTPLLNYATTSWFVEVTKIKDALVAQNNKVHWVPEHIGTNRFGNWLEGARDWAVSRQRYWGAPLPIWRNKENNSFVVIGSKEELLAHTKRSGNTYLMMRHGQAESNVANILSGDRSDENPLTEQGREEVLSHIAQLKEKGIDLIIASPFQRVKESAELLAHELGIPHEAIVYDERIGEIDFGELNGKTFEEYHALLKSAPVWNAYAPQGGESWNDVKKRAGEFLYEIDAKYQNKRILVVSHNSPLRMFGMICSGTPLEAGTFDHDEDGKRYENGEIRELTFTPLPHNDLYDLDYHRPYIDRFPLYDEQGNKLERIGDVFDCWFESGAMPYGQNHYPFENLDVFNAEKGVGFPAQFIAEGLDQTRGWFYSLIVLGVALFGKSPYENVIVNGLVLAEDGKKMSKSLKNYPDPMLIADTVGVDAMRLYLLSAPIMRAEDLNFSEKGVLELQRKNIGRLHNVLALYELFANDTKADATSDALLDRWVLARLYELISEATNGFELYELDKATRPIIDFIDDLSVWYVRRSRERLKSEDIRDQTRALGTLRYVLRTLALVMAPSMPFYAEYLWSRVKEAGDAESVHLASWPEPGMYDAELLETMRYVRSFANMGLMLRTQKNVKVRQPLERFTIHHDGDEPAYWNESIPILADELNVKEVVLVPNVKDAPSSGDFNWEITPQLKAEGDVREFIRSVQELRKQQGLQPQDRVTLTILTSKKGEEMVGMFEHEILRVVGALAVHFAENDGTEVTAGEHSFTVSITKQ